MSYDIKGKTVLVTGANRGIGKAYVETFLQHGAKKVYAAVRSLKTAGPLVEQYGSKVVPVQLDLSDPASIQAAAKTASDVQVVINNGGVLKTASPLDADALEALAYEMDVNVNGLIRMAQAFAPVLKANGGGVFGQLNSVVSLKSFAQFSTYSASKAAAYSITQALRDQLKEQGTIVVSIHPGPIDTDMGAQAGLQDIAEPPALVPEATLAALKAGEFHVFPDSMAKQIGGAYQSFAAAIIDSEFSEG